MDDSREIKIDPMYNPEDLMHDINSEVEKYKPMLTPKEFGSHLDEWNFAFRDEVMDKVFLLKFQGNFNCAKFE